MREEIETLNLTSASRVIKIQEEEREKFAYNLHDSVGQYVTALKWGLAQLGKETSDESVKNRSKEFSKICENIIDG